jgi:Nucleoside-diphosphate-sugar epimerases
MDRIFITGICGFLGSNLAFYFKSLGIKVYGIDNLSRKGSKKNFYKLKKNGIKVGKET